MTVHDFPPGKYRLRVADYQALCETGALAGTRSELLDGEIIVMSPQYRPHGFVKTELYDALRDALREMGSRLRPLVELSLAVDEHSMPMPDLLLTSEPYGEGPVPLASVALVIEVADTTQASDLGDKARLYAGSGIPEYWVADLAARQLVRMWAPEGEAYAQRDEWAFGARVESATIMGLRVQPSGLAPSGD